jgi:penicillin-insensitive murein endopeptidase
LLPAKQLFGHKRDAAPLPPQAIGFYSRGCLAGGEQLEIDGPAWQAMRLSRNRNWGHPKLVRLVRRLATDAKKHDGWPGLLVGDLAQPRGGPMLTGHASHQIGLDADIWFTPMPNRRLSRQERERLSATSMLENKISVNERIWSANHVRLIRRAASYPEVERILVHPAIKQALCKGAKEIGGSPDWLAKVRPYWGHHYHFHVRIGCPPGSNNCRRQKPTTNDTGCTSELAYWFNLLQRPPQPKPQRPQKPRKRQIVTLDKLPAACRTVLDAAAIVPPQPVAVQR